MNTKRSGEKYLLCLACILIFKLSSAYSEDIKQNNLFSSAISTIGKTESIAKELELSIYPLLTETVKYSVKSEPTYNPADHTLSFDIELQLDIENYKEKMKILTELLKEFSDLQSSGDIQVREVMANNESMFTVKNHPGYLRRALLCGLSYDDYAQATAFVIFDDLSPTHSEDSSRQYLLNWQTYVFKNNAIGQSITKLLKAKWEPRVIVTINDGENNVLRFENIWKNSSPLKMQPALQGHPTYVFFPFLDNWDTTYNTAALRFAPGTQTIVRNIKIQGVLPEELKKAKSVNFIISPDRKLFP